MDEFDERALVTRCQRGDDSAFAELVDRYKNLVYAMIYRMMSDRDAGRRPGAGRVPEGPSRPAGPPWRGPALDLDLPDRRSTSAFRRASSRRADGSRSRDVARALRPPTVRSRIWSFGTGSRRRWRSFPSNYRFLIAAHYLKGVQYKALAEALDVPLGTVKTHLYRAQTPAPGTDVMTCREILERVEASPAATSNRDEAARTHIETCPRCAAALADAEPDRDVPGSRGRRHRCRPASRLPSSTGAPPALAGGRAGRPRVQRRHGRGGAASSRSGWPGMFNVGLVVAVAAALADGLRACGDLRPCRRPRRPWPRMWRR